MKKNDIIVVCILGAVLIGIIAWFVKINPKEQPKTAAQVAIDKAEDALIKIKAEQYADSVVKKAMSDVLFDTVGVGQGPVKVISAKVVQEEYSTFKSVRLSWKNISKKKISAIRFKWYGLNAFGEPADMGSSIQDGFGGGYTDDPIRAGGTDTGTWEVLSRDAKKIVIAWPYEVVFEDGTKWESSKK